MSTVAIRKYSVAEYLSREAVSIVRHEYYGGEIFAMAGNTPQHNKIQGNLYYRLRQALEGSPCDPFGSDQRIRIEAVNLFTYSDVVVICGEFELAADDPMSVTNPRVIFEILSPSTEAYDRGEEFEFYQHLASLQEYILVSQDRAHVDRFVRQPDGDWRLRPFTGLEDTLEIESLKCRIPLALVYENVKFAPPLGVQDAGVNKTDNGTTH
ncbi:MAG TPA: Uma2 family endonuclease [Pirellulaceae bacterium]|nr:Uma2 family endonuclease [Pirellulaceae bacterium]